MIKTLDKRYDSMRRWKNNTKQDVANADEIRSLEESLATAKKEQTRLRVENIKLKTATVSVITEKDRSIRELDELRRSQIEELERLRQAQLSGVISNWEQERTNAERDYKIVLNKVNELTEAIGKIDQLNAQPMNAAEVVVAPISHMPKKKDRLAPRLTQKPKWR